MAAVVSIQFIEGSNSKYNFYTEDFYLIFQTFFAKLFLFDFKVPHPAMSLHHQDVTLSERLEELTSEVDSQSEALSSFNRALIRKLESEIVDLSRCLEIEDKPESHKFCAHLEAEFVEFFIPRDKRLISIGRGPVSQRILKISSFLKALRRRSK